MRRRRQSAISAKGWNDFVERYFRNRVLSVLVIDEGPWRHPWWTDLEWSAVSGSWAARILPGFCLSGTGADPQVSTWDELVSKETLERLGMVRASGERVDAYLSESPRIAIAANRWRPIGTDAVLVSGATGESVPERFAKRGVMGPVVLDTGGDGGAVTRVSGLVEDRREARLLRACDLVLTHDRVRSVIAPSLVPGLLDISFQQVATISRPGPWVEFQRKFEPASERGVVDVLLGAVSDTGRDELHLATCYLLSPPGQEPGSEPDESWEGSVEYHREWNLQYRATYEDTIVEPTRLSLAVPQLGLGALGIRAQPILDEINRRTAELEEALRRVENVGTFSLA